MAVIWFLKQVACFYDSVSVACFYEFISNGSVIENVGKPMWKKHGYINNNIVGFYNFLLS